MTIAEWWSEISEQERRDMVGTMNGVWVFGGVEMCFALLPKDAKIRAYEVFTEKYAKCEPKIKQYWRQSEDGQSSQFVEERTL